MDLSQKSYIMGLLMTDGNLYLTSRNRGHISIELSQKDQDILLKLNSIIPNSKISYRTRKTNFSNNYTSCTFANYQLIFRNEFIKFGYPIKNKTLNATIPSEKYIEKDFWRGIIDGDGSLGITKDNKCFLSLVTKSEKLKDEYLSFLKTNFNIIKNVNRNKRDNIYNISLFQEDAILAANFLYENSTLFLQRKYLKYQEMLLWKRSCPKITFQRKKWTLEEDKIILNHSLKESMKLLGRTEKSIKIRLYRISNKD